MPDVNDFEYWRRNFSHHDPELIDKWPQVTAMLREKCPVFWTGAHDGAWVLTRYEDLYDVSHDQATFSSFPCTVPPFGNVRPMIPLEVGPPLHGRFRSIVNPRFTVKAVSQLEDKTRTFVNERIDSFLAAGRVEVAEALCTPLPLTVIGWFLGIPQQDFPKFVDWTNKLIHPFAESAEAATAMSMQAAGELLEYFGATFPERRENPGEDLISLLLHAEVDGQPLSDEQVLDFCMLLLPAGFETTASSAALGVLHLAETPDLQRELRADLSLIPDFIEEFLRFETPVKGLGRSVAQECEFRGNKMSVGEPIILFYAGANHDPAEFPEPEDFQLGRSPNRHVAFGSGPHKCLGQHLARMELKVLFECLLTRVPTFSIEEGKTARRRTGHTWGVEGVPLAWDVNAVAAATR